MEWFEDANSIYASSRLLSAKFKGPTIVSKPETKKQKKAKTNKYRNVKIINYLVYPEPYIYIIMQICLMSR